MRKLLVTFIVAGMFTASGLAAQQVTPRPGLIGSQSALYPLDVALDNAAVDLGLEQADQVVFERASEAVEAYENNDSEAAAQALEELNNTIADAALSNTTGLEKASTVLNAVKLTAPDAAQQGLDTALDQIGAAQERVPDTPATDARP